MNTTEKRARMNAAEKRAWMHELTTRLTDQGKLLETGFVTLRAVAIPDDAPAHQVKAMRAAYMAGAQHLFASLMVMIDPGADASLRDPRRMDLIGAEIEVYRLELGQWIAESMGKPQ